MQKLKCKNNRRRGKGIFFAVIALFIFHFSLFTVHSQTWQEMMDSKDKSIITDEPGKENIMNSDDLNSTSYFYEPYPQAVGSSILQLGGSFTLVPLPLVEDEYPIPAIDLQYKRGLYKNISLAGTFSTVIVSNILHCGIQWNMNIERFSFGIANHIGGFGGYMTSEGQFDNNTAYAIFYMPIIRLGYRFDNFSLSTSWVSTYLFKCVSKVSNLNEINIDNTWNDYFCTIAIEQPFLKHQQLSIGLSIAYSRSPYQAWILYNTIDQYLFAPEFFFAFQL